MFVYVCAVRTPWYCCKKCASGRELCHEDCRLWPHKKHSSCWLLQENNWCKHYANVVLAFGYFCTIYELCRPTFQLNPTILISLFKKCAELHCESKKTIHYNIFNNFAKCWPIFNFFSLTDSLVNKYATKSSLTVSPYLTRVAELPCETSVSENSENLMHASLSIRNHKVV